MLTELQYGVRNAVALFHTCTPTSNPEIVAPLTVIRLAEAASNPAFPVPLAVPIPVRVRPEKVHSLCPVQSISGSCVPLESVHGVTVSAAAETLDPEVMSSQPVTAMALSCVGRLFEMNTWPLIRAVRRLTWIELLTETAPVTTRPVMVSRSAREMVRSPTQVPVTWTVLLGEDAIAFS